MADVLIGEATAAEADVRVLRELFQRMERVLDVAAVNANERAERLQELAQGVNAALVAARGGFVWNVAPWGFVVGTHAVWEPSARHAAIPRRLFCDGFRTFGLLHGASGEELGRFVDLIAIGDEDVSAEDDRVTLLAEAGLEHIAFRAVDVEGCETASQRASLSRARHQIAAVATFDTTAQLEECWDESRKASDELRVERLPSRAASPELGDLPSRLAVDAALGPARIARAARAALPIATQAGAVVSIARHIADQLEHLEQSSPEIAAELGALLLEAVSGRARPDTSPEDAAALLVTRSAQPADGPRESPEQLAKAAFALASLSDLIAAIAGRGATSPGISELADQAEQALRAALSAHAGSLGFSFSRDAVFVRGCLLQTARDAWERITWLADLMTRLDVIELLVAARVTRDEILAMATALGSAAHETKAARALADTRFGSLALVRGDARADDLARMPEGRRVLHVYAGALTALRELHTSLACGQPASTRAIRRAAQQLAAEEPSTSWLGLTTLAAAHRDDPGRAVQAAIVALAVAREITGDIRFFTRLALAALLTDAGRPALTFLAGRSPDVDPSLEAHVPAATAMVGLASGSGEIAAWRAAVAFENAWLERAALLGPLDNPPPSLAAELLWVSRRYLDGIAPRDGRPRLSPADALRSILDDPRLDAGLKAAFLRALGTLPPGTVVELSTGEWAVVLAGSGERTLPLVRALTNARGHAHSRPVDLDLAASTNPASPGILGVVSPSRARFNVARAFFGST